MAIVVAEKYKGRRRDATSAEFVYVVQGTDADAGNVSEQAAYNAVAGVSGIDEYDGLPIQNINVSDELVIDTIWQVEVTYGLDGQFTVFDTGSVQYEFNFTAPVGRIYYSLETRSATGPDGLVFSTTELRGKIRGQGDDEDGIDLPNPSPTHSWVFNIPNGSVSDAYQHNVEKIMGSVNSSMFKGRAADTMRLVGCSGGARNNKDWQIRFDFQFAENRTNVALGNITVPSIHGHNLIWDLVEDHTSESFEQTVRRPKAVLVERVFHRQNFGLLGF